MELDVHKLTQDVVTRWNSSYDMLARYLEQQEAIAMALSSKELRKAAKDVHALSDAEIINAEEIVKLMGPVKIATTVMCEEDQPTVSVIAPLHAKLLKRLQACEGDSDLVTDIKTVMKDDLSTRYNTIRETLNTGVCVW